MVHVGIRPEYPLTRIDNKRKIYFEQFPDGEYRIWNLRMLKSGCGKEVDEIKEMMDCIYCPTCKEWFNTEQWEEM